MSLRTTGTTSLGLLLALALCNQACRAKDPTGTAAAPEVSARTANTAPALAAAAAPTAAEPRAVEPSVKPGINAPYFEDGALDKFSRILERETREVVAMRDPIVEAMKLRPGMIVADIGAGTGLFTTEIARRVGDHGKVFAIDIVPSFLDRIRERVEAEQLNNVVVVHGTERETNLKPQSVDLAFLCDTYHHIEYPKAYLESLRQTMRPGASLVLIDLQRIEGKTSPERMKHVRAGKETVIGELQDAGFVLESERKGLLEENYLLYLRRP